MFLGHPPFEHALQPAVVQPLVGLTGLQERPALNGELASIVDFDAGRYRVRLLRDESVVLSVRPANVVLPCEARARVCGLSAQPRYNGAVGTVLHFDPAARRYELLIPPKKE